MRMHICLIIWTQLPLHTRHASAMIKMVQLLGGQPLDVKYYMIIFLKFIQVSMEVLLYPSA